MPYNTRRKSLSLPSLGIHLPKSQQQHHHHSAVPAGAKGDQPPQKRFKREHSSSPLVVHYDLNLNLPPSPPPESTTGATVSAATTTATTTGTRPRISHDGINDEIVSGVVDVLERTDNRPHTVKELAAVLSPVLSIVENSANPHAIISSRLNTFLKRGFSPASPCVLAKQLITTHPKRIYFYLTTSPHKPIPKHENDPSRSPPRRAVVSPALSDDDDGRETRRRLEPSPSPEVDLSSHDLDHVDDTAGPPSPACSSRDHQPGPLAQKSSLSSPPLEGDEREFSQSAIYIGRRSSSHEAPGADMVLPMMLPEDRTVIDASPLLLDTAKREHHHHHHQHHHHPRREDGVQQMGFGSWSGELERYLASPESVELDELDGLLDF